VQKQGQVDHQMYRSAHSILTLKGMRPKIRPDEGL